MSSNDAKILFITEFHSRYDVPESELPLRFSDSSTYPSGFNLRHEDEHQLVLVNHRTDPEDDSSCDGDERGKGREEQSDGSHEQHVGAVYGIYVSKAPSSHQNHKNTD